VENFPRLAFPHRSRSVVFIRKLYRLSLDTSDTMARAELLFGPRALLFTPHLFMPHSCRVPDHELQARNQRLSRAIQLCIHKEYLDAETQKLQKPFGKGRDDRDVHYLLPELSRVEAENRLRAELGMAKPFRRTIP